MSKVEQEAHIDNSVLSPGDRELFDGIVAHLNEMRSTSVFPGRSEEIEEIVKKDKETGEVFQKGVLYLKELYQGRHVTERLEDGTIVTRFGTRDDVNPNRIDDLYEVREHPLGETECSVVIMPVPEQGFKYSLDKDGCMKIQAVGRFTNRMYGRHERAFKEAESFMLRRAFRTAGIVKRRWEDDPVAAHEADTHARDLTELQFGL